MTLRTRITDTLQGKAYSTPLLLAMDMKPSHASRWPAVRDELKRMQAEGLVTGTLEGLAKEPIRLVAS